MSEGPDKTRKGKREGGRNLEERECGNGRRKSSPKPCFFSIRLLSEARERNRETRANPCLLTPSAVTRGGGGIELGDWLGIEDGEREDAPNPAFLYRYARVVYLAGMTRTRLPRQKKVLFVGNFLTDVIRSAGNQHAMGIIDLRSTRCTAVRAVLPVTVTYTCKPVLMPLLRRGQVLQNAAVRCKHWTGRRSRRGLLFP